MNLSAPFSSCPSGSSPSSPPLTHPRSLRVYDEAVYGVGHVSSLQHQTQSLLYCLQETQTRNDTHREISSFENGLCLAEEHYLDSLLRPLPL